MDRRRFVPSSEGLEGRQLLSTAPTSVAAATGAATVATTSNVPNSAMQKSVRIERLPFFLRNVEPGRTLPGEIIDRLQADLHAVQGKLNPPPAATLEAFNKTLGDVLAKSSLGVEEAKALNQTFGAVLDGAGTPPALEAELKQVMNALARVDAGSSNSTILATSDYALTLQTILGVGRPITTPTAPTIAQPDTLGSRGGRITSLSHPRLVGTYSAGTTIEIVNEAGAVIGSEVVPENGRYTITIEPALADGTHTVRARAVDSGEFSAFSPSLTFRVVTQKGGGSVPGGPRGFSTR